MKLRTIARTIKTLGQGVTRGIDPAVEVGDPLDLFTAWYREAEDCGIVHPEAMLLATASRDGMPSARVVLLKEVDTGFVFYTNLGSRKGQELASNPRAALTFHWAVLERQVRIEGLAERVSREQAAAYYHSRPRGSQIGAWASRQSATLDSREALEQRVARFEEEFGDAEVPLPDFWGGFRVVPDRLEFWQGRSSRLHDRLVFERVRDIWTTRRLYP